MARRGKAGLAWRGKARPGEAGRGRARPGVARLAITTQENQMFQDIDAIERLKSLERKGGELTPDAVVEDAKNKTSPLHRYFDWKDREAAHKWRLEQARTLIRGVRFEVETTERSISVVGYVRDPGKAHDEQGYLSTARIRSDEDRARAVVEQELVRAEAAMTRAYDVAISLGLQGEFDTILARIRGVRNAA
jgi:hypothetical protein